MAKMKLVFYGSEISGTDETELEVFANNKNELFIQIKGEDNYYPYFIALDRDTAIKFSKEIRKQISYLESEGSND